MSLLGVTVPAWPDLLYYLGCLSAARLVCYTLSELRAGCAAFLLPALASLTGSQDWSTRFGSWGLVTGAGQGLGREYALALAQRGLNVILASRTKSSLVELANEIENKYSVKTLVVVVDFTQAGAVDQLLQKIKELEVGVLVNNVGMMGPHFIPFLETERKTVQDMISVNTVPATLLCHALIPGMLERDRGAVINIVSATSHYTMPYFTQYSATKHYLSAMTGGLQAELAHTNLVIQQIDPGQLDTNMARDLIPMDNIQAPKPDRFVGSAIRTLGWTDRTGGWWFHSLHRLVSSLLPSPLLSSTLYWFGWFQYRYSSKKTVKQQ